MELRKVLALAAFVAAFVVSGASAQYCWCPDGSCHPTIFGCDLSRGCYPSPNPCPEPTPTPTPSPTPPPTPTPPPAGSLEGDLRTYPGYPVPSSGPLNYVQGPAVICPGDGGCLLLVNSGHCCTEVLPGTYEGMFALISPPASPVAQWLPLFGTNVWGTDLGRDEHEAAFPAAVFVRDRWLLAYAATTWTDYPLRPVTVGLATAHCLMCPWTWQQGWIGPRSPELVHGTGVFPANWVWWRGQLQLIAYDYSVPGVVRYAVDPTTLAATYLGQDSGGANFNDVGVQGDRLYALSGWEWDTIGARVVEWVYDGGWVLTGRSWGDEGVATFDGHFARRSSGEIVSPQIIVANQGDGRYADEAGAWWLHWWAEPGAAIPPSWLPKQPRTIRVHIGR